MIVRILNNTSNLYYYTYVLGRAIPGLGVQGLYGVHYQAPKVGRGGWVRVEGSGLRVSLLVDSSYLTAGNLGKDHPELFRLFACLPLSLSAVCAARCHHLKQEIKYNPRCRQ